MTKLGSSARKARGGVTTGSPPLPLRVADAACPPRALCQPEHRQNEMLAASILILLGPVLCLLVLLGDWLCSMQMK